MTTIATDGRLMAADGRVTGGNEILMDREMKLSYLPDGSVIGLSGMMADADEAVAELAASITEARKPAPMKGSYRLLRLLPNGKIFLYHERLTPGEVSAPASIGSGGDYAKGAMLFGADPVEAIKVAKKTDPSTGGKIRTLAPR